jgi:hypothetical protein
LQLHLCRRPGSPCRSHCIRRFLCCSSCVYRGEIRPHKPPAPEDPVTTPMA